MLQHFDPVEMGEDETESNIDRCIFTGFLRDEPQVRVTLTGGCPFETSFEVSGRGLWFPGPRQGLFLTARLKFADSTAL